MFMFQKTRKTKLLWTACEKRFLQYKQDSGVMPNVQPQRHRPQHPHRPQEHQQFQLLMLENGSADKRNNNNNSSSSPQQLLCASSSNFCGEADVETSTQMEMESGSEEMSIDPDYELRKHTTTTIGCCYENCCDNSNDCNEGDDCEQQLLQTWQLHQQQQQSIQSQLYPMMMNESNFGNNHYSQIQNQKTCNNNNNNSSNSTSPMFSVTSAISAGAASVFRHCCRGFHSNESSTGSSPPSYRQSNRNSSLNYNNAMGILQNNNNNNSISRNFYDQKALTLNNDFSSLKREEQFNVLTKNLTTSQLNTLCHVVVENRRPLDCVLVKRQLIAGEEANLIACRLWLWPDLRTSTELKRVPMCPNGKDPVYICCNPAHWNRIVTPETAPPPYRQSEMDRLKPEDRAPSENLKDGGVSTTTSYSTTGLRGQIPESFTTNGEDHSSPSPTWCQIAYWELTDRVGDRYEVKNSTVNIYSEGSGGMCLKELAEKKPKLPESVQKTRQKIGLGITLSQEADGVWLYNRSEAPIFVHSPTLNDDYQHVSKVPPGYCLNAFDNNRARTQRQVCPTEIAGALTGPIDTFSMKISFAKGWGANSKYHRKDITACECWLEVLFSRR